MKKILNLILSAIFFAAMVTGCQSPEEKVEKAKENLNSAEKDLNKKQTDSVNEYQTAKADWEKQMAENDNKIQALTNEKNSKEVTSDKEYNAKISALRQQNEEMRKKANNYQYSSTDTKWLEFKEGFNKDMKDLGNGITDLKNKIVKKTDK